MAFLKGFLAFMFFLVLVIVLWYFTTGFKVPKSVTTTISNTVTSTVSGGTTTIAVNQTTTTSIPYIYDCKTLDILSDPNANTPYECSWTGGPLGLWVASGNTMYENVIVTGADNKTYMTASINYQCTTFYDNFTAPQQVYTLSITTGNVINDTLANCQYAIAKLNTTLTPPKVYYQQVYNGGFADGKYTGWTTDGTGFGPAPVNVTYENGGDGAISNCYIGSPWSNYNGTYFATTYNCGLSNSPGNLTSATFYANKPFLNFQIVSPQDNFIYVEILYNNTPYTIARYNTYNTSLYNNSESTFRNASIPLFNVIGKPIQVRVVADTLLHQDYVAVGNFGMVIKPVEDKGILYNLTFLH